MNEKILLSAAHICFMNGCTDINNGCAVAVGSFDGIHLGHQKLLSALKNEAKRLSLPAVVFTFDTDDNPKSSPLLATSKQKNELLCEFGVDAVVSVPFSALCGVSAEDFALEYLYEGLHAQSIVCGYDFKFGKDRLGDVGVIKTLLSPMGVNVVTPDVYLLSEMPVSSTSVRNLISNGDVKTASRLLGRYFSFSSTVRDGAKLGRKLGFPTINQHYPESLVKPRYGVYAVRVHMQSGKTYGGVANFGIKPTVGGEVPVCETHIFGYSGDCYGETVEISFVAFIRDEQKFNSLDELKTQVDIDKKSAQDILVKENRYE